MNYNVVAATNEDTVVATYEPSKVRSDSYQSEAELEKEFIRLLCEQGYTYLPLHTEDELIANLRSQLEELNHYQFSDTEWQQFFSDVIANPNEHIPEKTRKIQEDNVQVLHRDDGSSKNITLIDKKNIHNNRLQVINQYERRRRQDRHSEHIILCGNLHGRRRLYRSGYRFSLCLQTYDTPPSFTNDYFVIVIFLN